MIQPPNQSSLSDNIPQRDDSVFLKKENHPHSAQTIKTSNQNQAIKQPPPLLTKHFERERRGGCPLSLFRVFFCVRRGVEAKSMTFRELPPQKPVDWRQYKYFKELCLHYYCESGGEVCDSLIFTSTTYPKAESSKSSPHPLSQKTTKSPAPPLDAA